MKFFDEYIHVKPDYYGDPTYTVSNDAADTDANGVTDLWKLPIVRTGDFDKDSVRVKEWAKNQPSIPSLSEDLHDVPVLDIVDSYDDYTYDGGVVKKVKHNYIPRYNEIAAGPEVYGIISDVDDGDSNDIKLNGSGPTVVQSGLSEYSRQKVNEKLASLYKTIVAREQDLENMQDALAEYDNYYNEMYEAGGFDDDESIATKDDIKNEIKRLKRNLLKLYSDKAAIISAVTQHYNINFDEWIKQHKAEANELDFDLENWAKERYRRNVMPMRELKWIKPDVDKLLELYFADTQSNINNALAGRR